MALLTRLERASRRTPAYRWYALGVTTYSQAAVAALVSAVGPLAPLLLADFRVSRAEIGLTTSATYLSSSAIALWGGRAADRVGERRVLLISGVIVGLAALLALRAASFWPFLGVCFVIGFGSGIQNPAGSAAIMRWFPRRQRGFAMGIRQTGVPLGGVLAASLWPVIGVALGWRWAYLVGGSVMLLGALSIAVAYYDPIRPATAAKIGPRRLADLVADRQMLWLGIVFLTQIAAQQAAMTYFVLFLNEAAGVAVVLAAALLAVVNFVAISARIGWGLLSDRRFGGDRKPVLSILVLLSAAAMLLAAALPSHAPLALAGVLALLLGASVFAWTGVIGALVIETAGPESAASAMALAMTIAAPGSLLGPPLFGLLADRTGSYRVAWLAAAAVVGFGLFALSRVKERSAGGGLNVVGGTGV
ncbi:MAG: MFS transporter [Chloroflexota bacterium]|nr:MFS transporter [Chloroflexota bacterium]